MKIKEVQAGIKITKNYDSYQAGLSADLEIGEDPVKVGEDLIEKALIIVNKKIGEGLNKSPLAKTKYYRGKEMEVGAAWPDKKSNGKLSVKDSETGGWSDVSLEELERIEGGYRQETDKGIFVFRKIPEEKRINNKMPMYRIYKVGGGDE